MSFSIAAAFLLGFLKIDGWMDCKGSRGEDEDGCDQTGLFELLMRGNQRASSALKIRPVLFLFLRFRR